MASMRRRPVRMPESYKDLICPSSGPNKCAKASQENRSPFRIEWQRKLTLGPRETGMKKSDANEDQSASELISKRILELGDWCGETLSRMRKHIRKSDPDVVEEWKWMGTPVWSHDGIICTGESYKNVVKLTFAKGAFLKDPAGLFNSSLDGNVRRAIDIHEGEEVDGSAFKALIREAIALNTSGKSKSPRKAKVL
jgi:hypothetical protein